MQPAFHLRQAAKNLQDALADAGREPALGYQGGDVRELAVGLFRRDINLNARAHQVPAQGARALELVAAQRDLSQLLQQLRKRQARV